LNLDSSATSRLPPQRGHFGRRRFSVAKVLDISWHVDWTIIFDPHRRTLTKPYLVIVHSVCGAAATTA
jgi:hypothetical protein